MSQLIELVPGAEQAVCGVLAPSVNVVALGSGRSRGMLCFLEDTACGMRNFRGFFLESDTTVNGRPLSIVKGKNSSGLSAPEVNCETTRLLRHDRQAMTSPQTDRKCLTEYLIS